GTALATATVRAALGTGTGGGTATAASAADARGAAMSAYFTELARTASDGALRDVAEQLLDEVVGSELVPDALIDVYDELHKAGERDARWGGLAAAAAEWVLDECVARV